MIETEVVVRTREAKAMRPNPIRSFLDPQRKPRHSRTHPQQASLQNTPKLQGCPEARQASKLRVVKRVATGVQVEAVVEREIEATSGEVRKTEAIFRHKDIHHQQQAHHLAQLLSARLQETLHKAHKSIQTGGSSSQDDVEAEEVQEEAGIAPTIKVVVEVVAEGQVEIEAVAKKAH
ncbi:hypothetical protein N7532_001092 [Penicillium argentinense]|uniref:Uncharacterized protein n=1 Tax=Penicillium argentinense TaxID=1131581 RepID=A0A9W9G3F0_9EURO|nr:uncharacterized protein N7532_001092 [Penicillium argentinense]KAJ5110557.1 hypothetical protein N7532_001092 [Penicillium argentinense]